VPNFVVLTSCTQRKRSGLKEPISITHLQHGTYVDVAKQWLACSNLTQSNKANQLYIGRSVKEAQSTARHLGGPLHFISTGFGLISESVAIPNYDLTIVQGANSLERVITDVPFSTQKWWAAINGARGNPAPIKALLERDPTTVLLIALSSTYLTMIRDELASLSNADANRLRIFSSIGGAKSLPEKIEHTWIPYDARFDGLASPNPGTRSDFPQRVMHHYATQVLIFEDPSLEREKAKVSELLQKFKPRKIPIRTRKTDGELMELMNLHWSSAKGQSALMLRVLRDDLLIACEQKRFADLFRNLRKQRNPEF
jgi:hypothetical protein